MATAPAPARRVLVTGGASGIGAATCRLFAAQGAVVGVLDRDGAGAAAVAAEVDGLGGRGVALAADVADSARVDEAVARFVDDAGGLTDVVSNVGVGRWKPLHTYTDAEWRLLVGVNLTGAFHVLRATVPHLLAGADGSGGAAGAGDGGAGRSIVHVASLNARRPVPGEGPYSAAKAGVVSLTQTAALEYAPTIRVNCVSPGIVDTPLTAPLTADPTLRDAMAGAVPARRFATAEEVASVIVFLCSDAAAYITGQDVVVDGGSGLLGASADRLRRAFGTGGPA